MKFAATLPSLRQRLRRIADLATARALARRGERPVRLVAPETESWPLGGEAWVRNSLTARDETP